MAYFVDNGAGYRMEYKTIESARKMALRLAHEPDWAKRKFGMKHFAMFETEYDHAVPVFATRTGKSPIGYVVLTPYREMWVTRMGRGWKYQDMYVNGKLVPASRIKPDTTNWDWTKFNYRLPVVYSRRRKH